MAVSSEDGVDRDSREYRRGYVEALDAVIQRLNAKMIGVNATSKLFSGLVLTHNLVSELRHAWVDSSGLTSEPPAT